MLKINGVDIATPQTFKVEISDLDGDSQRNARGKMMRDRIAVKRKLECSWPPLTKTQMSTLLTAVSGVFFNVTYPDPQTGTNLTKEFYVGDRTTPMLRYKDGQPMWEGLEMNFVER